jgi:hypothetical protein
MKISRNCRVFTAAMIASVFVYMLIVTVVKTIGFDFNFFGHLSAFAFIGATASLVVGKFVPAPAKVVEMPRRFK